MPAMTPLGPLSHALLPWQNFYVLSGEAAATLTGLMFVAITFGSSLVTKETATSARAFLDPSYRHFVQVILTAFLATVPTMGATVLGGICIGGAVFRLFGLIWVFREYREAQKKHGDVEASDWILAILLPLACHLVLLATGVGFLEGNALALTGLAVVVIALVILGIHGAWELLMWMALAVGERSRKTTEAAKP
jgi:small-conductance mechanosensitive channel